MTNLSPTVILSRDVQSLNMSLMSVTLNVSKEVRSSEVRDEQLSSIRAHEGSKETTKGNIETLDGPKVTNKGSKETIVASIGPNGGPKEAIEGSKVAFVGNIGTIDGSKETTNGSNRTIEGSKVTIKGNIGTFNGPKETVSANDTPHDGPKETIEGSKVSFACNVGTIKGNIGTIYGPYRTIDGSIWAIARSCRMFRPFLIVGASRPNERTSDAYSHSRPCSDAMSSTGASASARGCSAARAPSMVLPLLRTSSTKPTRALP